jgi:uncharacterized membrane protein
MMDMTDMMNAMGLWALLLVIVLMAGVAVAVYLGVRAARAPELPPGEDARKLLERRLAAGEISPEEFFELDSALRSGSGRR